MHLPFEYILTFERIFAIAIYVHLPLIDTYLLSYLPFTTLLTFYYLTYLFFITALILQAFTLILRLSFLQAPLLVTEAELCR